jgi:hypothetical protein
MCRQVIGLRRERREEGREEGGQGGVLCVHMPCIADSYLDSVLHPEESITNDNSGIYN